MTNPNDRIQAAAGEIQSRAVQAEQLALAVRQLHLTEIQQFAQLSRNDVVLRWSTAADALVDLIADLAHEIAAAGAGIEETLADASRELAGATS